MGKYYPIVEQPCPPLIGDYAAIVGGAGGNPCTPVEAQLNTFYSTDYISDGGPGDSGWVVFNYQLTAGKTYVFIVETSFTQPGFDRDHATLVYWQPSDWPGETVGAWGDTYNDIDDEDAGPLLCPYESKLNVELAPGEWIGGRRYEFTPTETGLHVFMLRTLPPTP